MAENTKNKKPPGRKPSTKPKTSSRAPSKAQKKKMRDERMKGTLLFGLKLVIVLALVAGVTHAYLYGKGIYDNNQGKELTVNASGDFSPESTLPDGEENNGSQTGQDSGQTDPSNGSDKKKETETSSGTSDKTSAGSSPETDAVTEAETSPTETVPVKVDILGPDVQPPGSEAHILPDVQVEPEALAIPPAQTGKPQAQDGSPQAPGSGLQAQNGGSQAQTTDIGERAPVLQSISSPGLVDPSKPMIAFTFDDGPYTKVDKKILDVLEANGGRATFFIVGSRVADYKETLSRIYNTGSEIGNHTFNHKNLEKLSPEEVVSQVEMTNDAVEAVTGFRPRLVRVPYGAYQGQVTGLVNYPIIQWNVDTEDWKNKDKASALDSILSHAKDGNIILMHDLYPSTAEAFEEAVPQLIAQGFQLVTVSEMYAAKGIAMEAGTVYFNIR